MQKLQENHHLQCLSRLHRHERLAGCPSRLLWSIVDGWSLRELQPRHGVRPGRESDRLPVAGSRRPEPVPKRRKKKTREVGGGLSSDPIRHPHLVGGDQRFQATTAEGLEHQSAPGTRTASPRSNRHSADAVVRCGAVLGFSWYGIHDPTSAPVFGKGDQEEKWTPKWCTCRGEGGWFFEDMRQWFLEHSMLI